MRGLYSFRSIMLGTAMIANAIALSANSATAQVYESRDGSVTVDWSVLDGTGGGQNYVTHVAPMAPFFNDGRGLQMPGANSPVSKLHVTAPAITAAAPRIVQPQPTPKVPAEPMVSSFTPPSDAAPVPAVVAPTPPAVAEAPEAKTAPAPVVESAPKPEPVMETATKAPTPPPPPAMPKAPVIEESAPAVPEPPVELAKSEPEAPAEPVETPKKPEMAKAAPPEPEMPAAPEPQTVAEVAPPPPAPPAASPPPALTPPTASLPIPEKPNQKAEETAALPDVDAMGAGDTLKVMFDAASEKVPEGQKASLDTIAGKLTDNESLRIQLLAYAGGPDLSSSKARRLSLSRALSVRTYLMDKGINSTRIHVRALGDKTTEEPINRVEVTITERN